MAILSSALLKSGPVALTACVYLSSVGLLFVGEALLAGSATPESFATYQLVRNALPVVVALGLLGLDQSLTREVVLRRELPRPTGWLASSLLAVSVAGCVLAIIIGLVDEHSPALVVVTTLASLSLGMLYLTSGMAKGLNKPVTASVFLQGYRGLLGIALIIGVGISGFAGSAAASIFSLTVTLVIVAIFASIWYARQGAVWVICATESMRLRKLGRAFSLPMVAVALVDWVDQLLVAALVGMEEAGQYGIAKLFVIFPVLSIASILSFIAMPYATRNLERLSTKRLRNIYLISGVASVGLAVAICLFSEYLIVRFYSMDHPWVFYVFLAFAAAARLFYIVPSAVVGAQGDARAILRVGYMGFLGLFLLAAACALGSLIEGGQVLVWAAGGLCLAHLLRCFASVAQSFSQLGTTVHSAG